MAESAHGLDSATAPVIADFARQGAVYDGLMKTLREGTFVHAYLISGVAGVGKRTLARLIAQALLCTGADKPCGACPACVQAREETHPDLTIIRPDKSIGVDAVREVILKVGEHTFEGGRRVVIIEQAEKMTPAAQNCLLKTLEEPVAGVVFLLVTDSPSLLLPTIISRCRALKLHPWPDEVVRAALAGRGVPPVRVEEALHVGAGSIGRALDVAVDEDYWQRRQEVMRDFFDLPSRGAILTVSTRWKDRKAQADELLDDVEDMLRTLLLVRLGRRGDQALDGYPPPWQRMAREGALADFASLEESVTSCRRLKGNQVTWQAAVERLLLDLMEARSRWET